MQYPLPLKSTMLICLNIVWKTGVSIDSAMVLCGAGSRSETFSPLRVTVKKSTAALVQLKTSMDDDLI
ncbi:hypothetical protein [Photobacterium leiognathi]|uniref:hypothetical protein n=1 Tax=Photobacterium leiognathi TaxID=553611 RepID=UPI001C62B04A|nr:hypothetical protein [Photobacterium leiognathi]